MTAATKFACASFAFFIAMLVDLWAGCYLIGKHGAEWANAPVAMSSVVFFLASFFFAAASTLERPAR